MQAMNGSAGPVRSHGRLIGCCMALALALSAVVFAPVASAAVPPPITTYVAIGDSLAFGYTQEKSEENTPNEPPSYFENGYASEYAKRFLKKENPGLVLVNNGCPGETTDSLFGTGPLGKAVDPTGTQACPYHFVLGLPLHTSLATLSQAENAISQLNPCFVKKSVCAPSHEIKMVTFNMAGNDELASIAKCKAEVKTEFETTGKSKYEQPTDEKEPIGVKIKDSILGCVVVSSTAVFNHIVTNTETMLGLIRSPSYGNYAGPLKVLGVYNPQSFVLPGSDALQASLNSKLATAVASFGAKFANPMPKINPSPEQSKAEKKAIEKYTEWYNPKDEAADKAKCEANQAKEAGESKTVIYPCEPEGDIHPSLAGAKVLAKILSEA
jgi:lysophospholipase L1-like esterase